MSKKQFFLVLVMTLASVILMSIAWEFWLEGILSGPLYGDHEVESLHVRLEYVVSIGVFAFISLIIPAVVGFRLIDNDEKQKAEIKRFSEEDYLTSLYNRRKISSLLENEITRCERYKGVFTVIFIDIDDFKKINDTFGHYTGDRVLRQFADMLVNTIRDSDIASRWGGEEFLVICPETNIDGASFLAEKLRGSIENIKFTNVGYLTASFGLASFVTEDNVESLVHRADEAVYAAKKAGKNRVIRSA